MERYTKTTLYGEIGLIKRKIIVRDFFYFVPHFCMFPGPAGQ